MSTSDASTTRSADTRSPQQEALYDLKSSRTATKSKLTRLSNNALAATNTYAIKEYLARLEPLADEFEAQQNQIDKLTGTIDEQQIGEFEAKYFSIMATLKERLSNLTIQNVASSAASVAATVVADDLPRIDLPKFAGSYQEWSAFRDLYVSLIHNKPVAVIKKFHHLRSCLTGGAAQLVESVPVTEENYEIAWALLAERYDKPRFIIEGQVKTFLKMQPITRSSVRNCLDETQRAVRALRSMNQDPNAQDTLLIQLLLSKTERQLKEDWQNFSIDLKLPTLEQFLGFLEKKCSVLEAIQAESHSERPAPYPRQPQRKVASLIQTQNNCPVCKQAHRIYQCKQFLNKTVQERVNCAKHNKLCLNCLRQGHFSWDCRGARCSQCDRKHNSLLHLETLGEGSETDPEAIVSTIQEECADDQVEYMPNVACLQNVDSSVVLLSTAVIELKSANDGWVRAKAMLDTGSQVNLMTDALVNKLRLTERHTNMAICGVNNKINSVSRYVITDFRSTHSPFKRQLSFLTLPRITSKTPAHTLDRKQFKIPRNIQLADPTFHRPSEVEVLLGAETFYELLCIGQIKNAEGACFQKTKLGWIVAGRHFGGKRQAREQICSLATKADNLEQLLPRFWELETLTVKNPLNQEEAYCESNFENTVQESESGRVIVTLPFRERPILGDSKAMAQKRFSTLEKQLEKNHKLKLQYHAFMREYIELGHMKEINDTDQLASVVNYLPHHGVVNEKSTSTKLRVVFDGSARTSNGRSLNDFLLPGPRLQDDLLHILLRFRLHKYALTADISKMFRQILLHPQERPLHRILWRFGKQEKVKSFELQTVTYGTTSASYLAIRAIQHLARKHQNEYPRGATALLDSFYVDDLLCGANTSQELRQIRDETVQILKRGGLELHKWASNHPPALPREHQQDPIVELNNERTHKTLGIQWSPGNDTFQYSIPAYDHGTRVTKRTIMSYVCSIFDPLGCLAPVVITAKRIIQQLWRSQLDWDESIPADLHSFWINYRSGLKALTLLRLPRNVMSSTNNIAIQLHGFSDASEEAYGACIYLVVKTKTNAKRSHLLCAKSRVAPLKTQSIPRLELCGAALLTDLMSNVTQHAKIGPAEHYYWSDSTIVIQWVRSSSSNYKTFVANRVGQIQTATHPRQWRHVPTQDNPADLISRGIHATELIDHKLWWHGPGWLCESEENWPAQAALDTNIWLERKAATCLINTTTGLSIFQKYSNLSRLVRVTAYCRRFLTPRDKRVFRGGFVASEEYQLSLIALIRIAQSQTFADEIHQLSKEKPVARSSSLLNLNPFLDELGLIRVGGRIKHSDLSYSQKHQLVLPHNHPLTTLIIRRTHEKSLHAGLQATLHEVRDKYWPVKAKTLIKKIVHNCVTCKRNAPRFPIHLLGDLPKSRLQPSRPFLNCGVDYCGPFLAKAAPRSKMVMKTYLALFVCLVTKAVHVEMVTNLTSEGFINALKRFVARRGKVSSISSDNATTFVGANRELREIYDFVQNNYQEILNPFSEDHMKWHFIPARSPHFGGLWEAGIKSLKFHLKRSSNGKQYTLEELLTLATQVEAMLNSRPLTPMSDDPSDLSALTPGHFLIGAPLSATVELDLQGELTNKLSRWQQVQQQVQHIWSRWRKSYLNGLQQRTKWQRDSHDNLLVGDLVIMKDDNLPVLRWPLGRVIETHPGIDGVVRVVTLKTKGSTTTRAVNKLCKLCASDQ